MEQPPSGVATMRGGDGKGKDDVEQVGGKALGRRSRAREPIAEQWARVKATSEPVPVRVRTEEDVEDLMVVSAGAKQLWVQPTALETEEVGEEEALPHPSVLFRFIRLLQNSAVHTVTILSLSGAPLRGEGAKALLQVLRDSSPPLEELKLDGVGLTLSQAAEVALAAAESTTLQRLSLARNDLTAEAGLPLAQLIRRSKPLCFLDVSGNQMRAKGILDLMVAVRDRELAQTLNRSTPESVMLEVSNVNVVVTLYRSTPTAGAAEGVNALDAMEKQFLANVEVADVPLGMASSNARLSATKSFQLVVSDNTLSANETAVLIMTELKDVAVVGVPETAATFTAENEKGIVTGFREPDQREARLAMKQQVERILDSGDGGQGAVCVATTEEALMLAQVLQSLSRPTVHMQFSQGSKHATRAYFIDAFLSGSSGNGVLQGLSFRGAKLGKAEVVPIARALNWVYPMIIRKLDLQSNNIGVIGAKDLGVALKGNRTLTSLDVADNALGPDGCKAILESIRAHPLLDRLSMGNNGMRAEGASILKECLVENQSLRRLDLEKNKLGPKGATHVARALCGTATLHRIDLSDNGVRTTGVVELLESLTQNNTLFRMNLAQNAASSQQVEDALTKVMAQNKGLMLLDLTGVTAAVTPAMEQAMQGNYSIRSLGALTSPAAAAIFDRNLANRVQLEQAVESGDIEKAKSLLPVAPKGYYERRSLLHHAVQGGPAMMRMLLDVPAIATQAMAKDREGKTPLHEAGLRGSTDAAHLLLQAGALPAIRDWTGKTAAELSQSEQFRRLMHAEDNFVLAFRQRNIDAVGSGSYYENISGLKSPLQAWRSDRPVQVGSRFSESKEPTHPFKYLVDMVAPPQHRSGRLSLDQMQLLRDLVVFGVLIAWMYELLEIPFRWGFAPNPLPGGYWALALFMDIVFLAWFLWTLAGHRTSWDPDSDSSEFGWLWAADNKVEDPAERPLQVAARRKKRRKRFLKDSSFYFMLAAAVPWDFVLWIIWLASGPTHVIDPVLLDVIQGLRIMRCGIIFVSQNHFQTLAGAFNLSWSVLDMSKMAIWFFYLINFFSALYFFSGRIALRYNEPSWLTIATFLDVAPGTLATKPVFTQYQFTMYFVAFGITNSPIFQNNWFEAFLWVVEFLGLGLVFVASVFGIILDKIGQLREDRAALQDCQDKIVEICDDLGLPDKVERKIVKKWLSMGSHGMSVEINSIGEMISPLSKDLRKEVTLHVIWSWIATWQERRDDLQSELDQQLIEFELEKRELNKFPHDVSLPAAFPFTLFWHTWLRKLCFHPERYIGFLVNIMGSIDQKFLLTDTVLYDYEDPSSNLYMVISGNVTMRLGRTRTGRENVEATLYPGDWFGWEALSGFTKKGSSNTGKPPRRTYVKANRNTTLYVVPGSKFRKLYLQDNEARFDLEDNWLANMDAEVLAWTLHHFPPKLNNNELVAALDNPLDKEQMKRVLLRSIVQRGEKDKTGKKGIDAVVKVLNTELADFKKRTSAELENLRTQNIALKESLSKQLAGITELLQEKLK